MESSYKIIKNSHIDLKEKEGKAINTSITNSNTFYRDDSEIAHISTDENSMVSEIKRQIKSEIEEERQRILNDAREEAAVLKEETKKIAHSEGYEDGYKMGYEDGITQGLNQGVNESLNIKKNALDLVTQSEEYVKEYFEENKDNFIKLAATMAESIVHKTIDTSDENIMMILEPILREYVHKENIIITCHPDNSPSLKDNLRELEELSGGNKIIILRDANLEKNGCTLENSKQFMDLQIKAQIENILKDIESME